MKSIVIASRNTGKITEITEIMQGLAVTWIPGTAINPPPQVIEKGSTYRENALRKARAFTLATHLPSLADDSGLEIDALNGMPGVRSNRYFGETLADPHKVECLLEALKDVPDNRRTARFRCVALLADESTVLVESNCIVEGFILRQPIGNSGFGYDPVFYYPRLNRTFAELTPGEKSAISHRGKAMREIRGFLLRTESDS
ncbi:RdgB/HAM1 family non-canonical purine NTP pyrophosphatase [bacterium]|nr:RdgB/HAM1 family non-canonical purine NTP pyrophosphatase [candidate division CSSED10-310 bacterium]